MIICIHVCVYIPHFYVYTNNDFNTDIMIDHTAIQNKTWAQEINHECDNWYIRNRNKWGNFHYILKWLIIPYCMQASLTAFGEMIWGFTTNIMLQAIFATAPILILLICGIKLGYFYDSFGIRREILMQFLMFIVAIPIYFSIVLCLCSHLSHNVYNILVEMSQGILIITLFTLLAVSSAYYPLHLIKYKNRRRYSLHSIINIGIACTRHGYGCIDIRDYKHGIPDYIKYGNYIGI